MKTLFRLILLFTAATSVFSEGIGKPRIVIDTPGGYKREVIPFQIEIPGAAEENNLDIRIEVSEGEGVVVTSHVSYSISYDTSRDMTEMMTTNDIGFLPLSEGGIKLSTLVKDKDHPERLSVSDELVLNIIPRPPLFKEHKPFLHPHLFKERYYVGEEILISYELFFSGMVRQIDAFKPDLTGLSARLIEPAEDKTVYYSREATTVRSLLAAVIIGETPGTLTLPPQRLPLTYSDAGETIEETLSAESIQIEILPVPALEGFSGNEDILIGRNLNIQFTNFSEESKFGVSHSFGIKLEGEANLKKIESLSPFLNLPGSVTETLIDSQEELQKGKPLSRLEFRYEDKILSFFLPRKIRFNAPFFNTRTGKWERIEEQSTEIKKSQLAFFLSVILIIVLLIIAIEINFPFMRRVLTKNMVKNLPDRLTEDPQSGQDHSENIDNFTKKYNLTSREQEISTLIFDGKSTTQMADDLFLSPETIKKHIKNIMKKTETHSRYEIFVLISKSIDPGFSPKSPEYQVKLD